MESAVATNTPANFHWSARVIRISQKVGHPEAGALVLGSLWTDPGKMRPAVYERDPGVSTTVAIHAATSFNLIDGPSQLP